MTTSASSASSGGGGAAGCEGYLDVAADDGAPLHYGSVCLQGHGAGESMTAVGWQFQGGAFPGTVALDVQGCVSPAANAMGLLLSATDATGPGQFTSGFASWTDGNGVTWGQEGDPFDVTFTKVEAVGGVLEGTFSVGVTQGGNAGHSLSGEFHVCRVSDILAP